jgi:hypothetical protein
MRAGEFLRPSHWILNFGDDLTDQDLLAPIKSQGTSMACFATQSCCEMVYSTYDKAVTVHGSMSAWKVDGLLIILANSSSHQHPRRATRPESARGHSCAF